MTTTIAPGELDEACAVEWLKMRRYIEEEVKLTEDEARLLYHGFRLGFFSGSKFGHSIACRVMEPLEKKIRET